MLRLTHLTIISQSVSCDAFSYLRFHTSQHSLTIRCYNRGMRQICTTYHTITRTDAHMTTAARTQYTAKDAARMISTSRSTATARSYSTLSDSTTYNARTTTHRTRSQYPWTEMTSVTWSTVVIHIND